MRQAKIMKYLLILFVILILIGCNEDNAVILNSSSYFSTVNSITKDSIEYSLRLNPISFSTGDSLKGSFVIVNKSNSHRQYVVDTISAFLFSWKLISDKMDTVKSFPTTNDGVISELNVSPNDSIVIPIRTDLRRYTRDYLDKGIYVFRFKIGNHLYPELSQIITIN